MTGGYVVLGRYYYGDYCSGEVFSYALGGKLRLEPLKVPALTSFGLDAQGRLYLLSQQGSIYRLQQGSIYRLCP